MTINNRNRRNRARAEPIPDTLEPLNPKCFVQQLSEVMGEREERQQSKDAQPTPPPKRRKSRRPIRAWWQDI